jgi:hypothetical protein
MSFSLEQNIFLTLADIAELYPLMYEGTAMVYDRIRQHTSEFAAKLLEADSSSTQMLSAAVPRVTFCKGSAQQWARPCQLYYT